MNSNPSLARIRLLLILFASLLVISGVTASFPVWGIEQIVATGLAEPLGISNFIGDVDEALHVIDSDYGFALYGYDWLAFGHVVIALFLVPVFREPVRYQGNISICLFACVLIIPLATLVGPLRGIPFVWQMIDCSFGVLGGLVLLHIQRRITSLAGAGKDVPHLPS